ncbi:MAG: alpha/beta hydrolase [Undibacterium sp.]|uniref:alpha/beta fold hydrolase n=1 Tax=Undibacterium sp. TaxID=1914977 RepID=UPI0027189FB0|nr:alpha/beta hydrolase [Undibacterium sp.]MDO8652189.1 alpha/beta hydrolase [Undibacterium sp.]
MKKISTTVILTISLVLAGCAGVENKLSSWAIGGERALAHVQTKQVVVGDFTIPYLEGGQGETVFLIHGFQSNKDIWIRLAGQLTSHYHVIAIDLPAHGESNILMDKNYSLPEQAKRVIAIMDALQINHPVHLMGHSMGGAIAYHVAVMAPDHVKSLALMNAAGVISPQPSEMFTRIQRGENPLIVRNEQEYKNMLAFTMNDAPYIPAPLIAAMTREAIAREPIATKIFQEIHPEYSLNPEQALPQIKVPTLVLWGDKDQVLDVSSTAVFKRLIPQSKVVILKGVGHIPQIERTKETAQIYESFLATVKL